MWQSLYKSIEKIVNVCIIIAMIGIDEIIVNNLITKDDGTYVIHIDHATLLNLSTNQIQHFSLETTGVTIDRVYRSYRDYVFFIQNNLIQFSGCCYSMSNFRINSNRVRLEKNGFIYPAIIVNNRLIDVLHDADINWETIPAVEQTVIPSRQYSLREISRDSQNVHNSAILNKFKAVYNIMVAKIANRRLLSLDSSIELILATASGRPVSFQNILDNVLKYVSRQNGYIYNLDSNETYILRVITSYISNCLEEVNQKNCLTILSDNLVDCVEDDIIVCLTGRVSRMINSVYHLLESDLSNFDKFTSIADAREYMLKSAMELFNSNKSIENIKESIIREFGHLSHFELLTEIDSWGLENLY